MRIVTLLVCAVASFGAAPVLANDEPDTGENSNAVQAGAPEAAPAVASAESRPAPVRHEPKLGPRGTDASGQKGRLHTVARGDTLWDISDAYLGTPWVWPSVWQDNPEIPNPHRIFPGDKLWITSTAMRRVTDAEAAALLGGEAPASFEDATPGPLGSVTVPTMESVGFVSSDALAALGSVVGSPRDVLMYAAEMPIYISLGQGQVEKGDRFTVVRAEQDVRDPETGRTIGTLVDKLGWVEVTRVSSETSEAVIRSSVGDIDQGDRLLPLEERPRDVAVRPATPPVEGQVALFPNTRKIAGGTDVVFLNRGTEHGLMVGSPLEIVRYGGEAIDRESGMTKLLPDDVVASLVVVSAEPATAVAVVTHAREEIARGDLFRGAATH